MRPPASTLDARHSSLQAPHLQRRKPTRVQIWRQNNLEKRLLSGGVTQTQAGFLGWCAFSKEGLGRVRYCGYPKRPKITGNALKEDRSVDAVCPKARQDGG